MWPGSFSIWWAYWCRCVCHSIILQKTAPLGSQSELSAHGSISELIWGGMRAEVQGPKSPCVGQEAAVLSGLAIGTSAWQPLCLLKCRDLDIAGDIKKILFFYHPESHSFVWPFEWLVAGHFTSLVGGEEVVVYFGSRAALITQCLWFLSTRCVSVDIPKFQAWSSWLSLFIATSRVIVATQRLLKNMLVRKKLFYLCTNAFFSLSSLEVYES